MRAVFLFIAVLLLPLTSVAAENDSPLLVLTRHAEKMPGDDPCLTEQGKQRAKKLATLLSEQNISSLLSTDYCRTRETLANIAEHHSLEIRHYEAEDSDAIRQALAAAGNGTVVVAAHSNTLPKLLQDFGISIPPIDESRYGDLFIIAFEDSGKENLEDGPEDDKPGRLIHLRY